ncbi:MAG: hypothetical protein GY755_14200 [Chloroflexi bacterium]|nr:hypothetical protein [Chloroflexota bacterium]
MNRFLSPVIAIAVGLLVLLGYFLPNNALLAGLRTTFVQWAVVLAAVALLVGVFNLLSVHIKKISAKEKGRFYSLLLVISLLITFFMGIFLGTDSAAMQTLFDSVILPVESSLLAIMVVTLIYAAIRLLRHRNDLMAFVFLGTVLIIMFAAAPLPFLQSPGLDEEIRPFIASIFSVFSSSGARGILIGVALGSLLTGLRVLIGADRPYGGK